MKKPVILIITIVLVAVILIAYNLNVNKQKIVQAQKNNKMYEDFLNVEVLGTDIASLMNKIADQNLKNSVSKTDEGTYKNNNSNSINLEIKFLELEETIKFEKIEEQGIKRFIQNFGTMSFKCTKIEYHQNTGNVKYMYFEQV